MYIKYNNLCAKIKICLIVHNEQNFNVLAVTKGTNNNYKEPEVRFFLDNRKSRNSFRGNVNHAHSS